MIRIADPCRIGATLGQVRKDRGMTRRELARRIERTGAVMSADVALWRWETGTNVPSLASLAVLLDELGYDLALIPREPTPTSGASSRG
jgi:transcriptional regulator with XRE-family HTH domain